jgi:hypothetical protein
MGRKKFVIIEKTRTKHDLVIFNSPIILFTWWERFMSLFNFEKYTMPDYFYFKGHQCQVSKCRLTDTKNYAY